MNLKLFLTPLLLISGCAAQPYWVRVAEAVEVRHIVRVDFPCAKFDLDGCWNAKAQTVEVKKWLKNKEDCVIAHERKHAAGYAHERRAIVYATDCGDGRLM